MQDKHYAKPNPKLKICEWRVSQTCCKACCDCQRVSSTSREACTTLSALYPQAQPPEVSRPPNSTGVGVSKRDSRGGEGAFWGRGGWNVVGQSGKSPNSRAGLHHILTYFLGLGHYTVPPRFAKAGADPRSPILGGELGLYLTWGEKYLLIPSTPLALLLTCAV